MLQKCNNAMRQKDVISVNTINMRSLYIVAGQYR